METHDGGKKWKGWTILPVIRRNSYFPATMLLADRQVCACFGSVTGRMAPMLAPCVGRYASSLIARIEQATVWYLAYLPSGAGLMHLLTDVRRFIYTITLRDSFIFSHTPF